MIYIFVITFLVLETLAVRASTLNVRTALFTSADLAKKRWNRRDIALLKARMYLQDLIPPIEVSQNPEYVSHLIRYIRDCYASVNRESSNSEMETILTDAVSDVFGGYLKMVALPVTKYVYYSDGLPSQEALQLFKYYEDIKYHLRTRGDSWSGKVTDIIKNKNIRGTRSDLSSIKIRNPCQQLLYLQNQQNLSIPMPSIDWNTRTMFVPLINQPIVDLRSPNLNPVLQRFHQVAIACERSILPDNHYFHDSFEDWVTKAVVPHLSDNDLYTAFKGILNIIENDKSPPPANKNHSMFIKPFKMSTTSMIIIIMLIFQLICCIPTLLCLRKKKMRKGFSNSSRRSNKSYTCESETKHIYVGKHGKITSSVNFMDYEITSKATSEPTSASGTRRSYSSVIDVATIVDESTPSRKCSTKTIRPLGPRQLHGQNINSDWISFTKHNNQISTSILIPKATSTFTAINLDEAAINASIHTGDTITLETVERKKSDRFRTRSGSMFEIDQQSPKTYSQVMFPTLGNVEKVHERSEIANLDADLKQEICDDGVWKKGVTQVKSIKKVDFTPAGLTPVRKTSAKLSKVRSHQSTQEFKNNSNKESLRVEDDLDKNKLNLPKVAIKIDRPKQPIKPQPLRPVVPKHYETKSNNRKAISKAGEEKAKTRKRPSKIPKKLNSDAAHCEAYSSVKRERAADSPERRIPKTRWALDDSAIQRASTKVTRFNITL